MANEKSGPVLLWGGWSLVLPGTCMVGRNEDGSWSAWDAARAVDVHIIEIGDAADGTPFPPDKMLGQVATTAGQGWIDDVKIIEDEDEIGPIHCLAFKAAAVNTYMSCWISFRQPSDFRWAETVVGSIAHR